MCDPSALCQDDLIYGSSFMLAPCAPSICQKRRSSSFVRMFTADFLEKSPPPEIMYATAMSVSKREIIVNVELSAAGTYNLMCLELWLFNNVLLCSIIITSPCYYWEALTFFYLPCNNGGCHPMDIILINTPFCS